MRDRIERNKIHVRHLRSGSAEDGHKHQMRDETEKVAGGSRAWRRISLFPGSYGKKMGREFYRHINNTRANG
jgi:hypothetical protein